MGRKPYDPPFSLRLSFEERARLEVLADGEPLGSYIRSRLLDSAPSRKRMTVNDKEALVRVLGLLGQSRLSSNINQLAKAVNSGSLPVTPETEIELKDAARDVMAMRHMLIEALGLDAGQDLRMR
jgi:hypothetical protein